MCLCKVAIDEGRFIVKYCTTEEMVADLFTKLVVAAQDNRLTVRFYSLVSAFAPMALSNDFKSAQHGFRMCIVSLNTDSMGSEELVEDYAGWTSIGFRIVNEITL